MVWCRNQKIYNSLSNILFNFLVVVWCRNQKIYNTRLARELLLAVVVWCRNQKIYNLRELMGHTSMLWFGVGIKRYTTQEYCTGTP